MRRDIYRKLPVLINLTARNPGKHSIYTLAEKVGLCVSTVWKYANELNLPVKKGRTTYTDEQIGFIKTHAAVMTNAETCKATGLKAYQAQHIANKLGITFMEKPAKQKVESEFFEHDKTGIW